LRKNRNYPGFVTFKQFQGKKRAGSILNMIAKSKMKNLLVQFGLAALLFSQIAGAQQQPSSRNSTIVLVRHAEKASNEPDAPLSAQGQERAACLARVLKDAAIKRIYVTDTKRTQQTAEPLARALNIKPTIVPANDTSTLIKDVFYGTGGNALVVGHSNTLPLLITRVQAGTIPPIGENEYDGLYVLTVMEGASTPVLKLHYCAASAPSGAPANMGPAHKATPTPVKKKKK
jgi:phosphohistidine phosphatase SixA